MSKQKYKSDGDFPSGTGLEERAGEGALDRLSALLPADALEDALAGLAPEEITGPGGLITQLAGRVAGDPDLGMLGYATLNLRAPFDECPVQRRMGDVGARP